METTHFLMFKPLQWDDYLFSVTATSPVECASSCPQYRHKILEELSIVYKNGPFTFFAFFARLHVKVKQGIDVTLPPQPRRTWAAGNGVQSTKCP